MRAWRESCHKDRNATRPNRYETTIRLKSRPIMARGRPGQHHRLRDSHRHLPAGRTTLRSLSATCESKVHWRHHGLTVDASLPTCYTHKFTQTEV